MQFTSDDNQNVKKRPSNQMLQCNFGPDMLISIFISCQYIFYVNARYILVCNGAELIIIFIYTIPQKPLILHMYQGTEDAIHNTALYQGICMNEQSDELFSHCFLNIV